MASMDKNKALDILEKDPFITNLKRFPALREGGRFAAIPVSETLPFSFVELCRKMNLEPGTFPDGLASSYQKSETQDQFLKQLKFLIQKDYAYNNDILDDDTTDSLCQDLFSFLKNTDYVVRSNFKMDNDTAGLSTDLGMGATFECGIFVFGSKPHKDGSILSFAIGFAAISED